MSRTILSHANCYANDLHPKTPAGRRSCRTQPITEHAHALIKAEKKRQHDNPIPITTEGVIVPMVFNEDLAADLLRATHINGESLDRRQEPHFASNGTLVYFTPAKTTKGSRARYLKVGDVFSYTVTR